MAQVVSPHTRPKVPAREAAPALGHTNRGEFQQLSSPAGAVGVGVRRAAWREKQGWQTCSLQRGWFRLPQSSLWMTPLTPAPPRALSQGSLLSPRQKEQGLAGTLPNQRGHDGERDLGTSKTGSFALYLSPSIPRPQTEPAMEEIGVTAWTSRSLGSREKDKIRAKLRIDEARYMLLLSEE